MTLETVQLFAALTGLSGITLGMETVTTLGGDISVTSEPGQRAHFVIRLPLQTLEPT